MWEDGVSADDWSLVSPCDIVRPWEAPAWSDKKGCQWTKPIATPNSGGITPFVPSSNKEFLPFFRLYNAYYILFIIYIYSQNNFVLGENEAGYMQNE